MISFAGGIVLLIVGYLVWGKITEKVFRINESLPTPAIRLADGVDYVAMDWKRAVLIQLLNIAGTGPIFGAIAGALFGPAAFLWIVCANIFAGAVHDFMVGMLSVRNDGKNISEIVGKYLGKGPLMIMRVFSTVLLIFVGVVFVTSPAQVLQSLFSNHSAHNGAPWSAAASQNFYFICVAVIILYYIFATMLPIDKIIGRIYPFFGACLLVMSVGLTIMLFVSGDVFRIPDFFIHLGDTRPDASTNVMAKVFPFLCISIACGAISGFHATQSPLMARCIKSEKVGRKVFYLAMILEGVIAMIWAAVTMAYIDPQTGKAVVGVVPAVSPPVIVTDACLGYMSWIGGILAVFGVVACPITSGDTAFRAARLTISEAVKLNQKPIKNRFAIAIPLFAVGIGLVLFSLKSIENFNIVWRYFAWSNQTLATIGLWAASAYLAKTGKVYWLTLIPATFMTVVVVSYFFASGECLGPLMANILGGADYHAALSQAGANAATVFSTKALQLTPVYPVAISIGLIAAVVLFALFIPLIAIREKNTIAES